MATERLRVPNGRGALLAAKLERPEGPVRAWALVAHGFTSTKDFPLVARLARRLAESGIGALRLDFTGLGESEGAFEDTDLGTNVEDLRAAADFMARELGAPALLAGHSLGGAACLLAAGSLASCRAVATLGTTSEPALLARALPAERLRREGAAEIETDGRRFRVGLRLLEDLPRRGLEAAVRGLGRPFLAVHGAEDELVPFRHAETLYGWAREPKLLLRLAGAGHRLSEHGTAERAARAVADWAVPRVK